MKSKNSKSLKLKKLTIANLKPLEASKVKGGACTLDWSGCDSFVRPCCTWDLAWSCTMPPECVA